MAIDTHGRRLLSRRVANDEPELLALIGEVLALGEQVTWAVDLADGGAALLSALLLDRDQRLLYLPGRTLNRAAGGYRGEGKTDARDAAIIAERARMRRDLPGIGVMLGAEFLAATGGDMGFFTTSDRLAGFAGLAPAPRDSGRVRGNLHRPRRYHRSLQRVFYTSAQVSIRCCPESRRFYDRKRAEGNGTPKPPRLGPPTHERLVGAPPRWALLRTDTASSICRLTTSLGSVSVGGLGEPAVADQQAADVGGGLEVFGFAVVAADQAAVAQ